MPSTPRARHGATLGLLLLAACGGPPPEASTAPAVAATRDAAAPGPDPTPDPDSYGIPFDARRFPAAGERCDWLPATDVASALGLAGPVESTPPFAGDEATGGCRYAWTGADGRPAHITYYLQPGPDPAAVSARLADIRANLAQEGSRPYFVAAEGLPEGVLAWWQPRDGLLVVFPDTGHELRIRARQARAEQADGPPPRVLAERFAARLLANFHPQ